MLIGSERGGKAGRNRHSRKTVEGANAFAQGLDRAKRCRIRTEVDQRLQTFRARARQLPDTDALGPGAGFDAEIG